MPESGLGKMTTQTGPARYSFPKPRFLSTTCHCREATRPKPTNQDNFRMRRNTGATSAQIKNRDRSQAPRIRLRYNRSLASCRTRRNQEMKKMFAVCFFVIASMLAYGQGVEQTLTQMEKDWSKVGMSKANLAADLKTVDRMMADDWVGIDFLGRTITKTQSIENLKTGAATTQSIELGAIKVRVFGDTAVVAVSDTEKSTYNGK